jgi:hypothetical protein
MRPIRLTGVVGTSVPVPLDAYAIGATTIVNLTGAGTLQMTNDNVFDPALSIAWGATPAKDATTGLYTIPAGIRAIRATGMAAPDVLVVSQQGGA